MVFHELSEYVYKWLKEQEFVKEESLTDWLLYNSNEKCSYLFYKSFTRNEESQNGADWEWWIITEKEYSFAAYRFLVQAKKLHNNSDNYPAITYGNKHGLQIDLLIDAAIKRNAFPIYSFYSTTQPDINQQIKNFKCFDENCLRWCESCINGVFLSSAKSIRKNVIELPKTYIKDSKLINNSLKLSLLDSLLNNASVSCNIFEKLNDYYIKEISDIDDDLYNSKEQNGIKYNKNNLPKYMEIIINRNSNDISWIEKEFHNELNEIKGIAVLDLREGLNN